VLSADCNSAGKGLLAAFRIAVSAGRMELVDEFPPMQALWNGTVIASSEDIETVEGNAYFPAEALVADCFRPSSHTSVCGWKGTAHYFDVVVNGEVNANAAWYYPEPKDAAKQIKGRVAFWKGVQVA
jgi:uncharacterized protein (DUF427 family)